MINGQDIVTKNLDRINNKIDELKNLSDTIRKSLESAQGDYRRKIAFAELLKALLEIEKTSLAYIKEANTLAFKIDKSLNAKESEDDGLNKLLMANIALLTKDKSKEDKK